MAKKKHKKRQYTSAEIARRQAEQERIADEKERARKRMDPTARTLLFADLIFLAMFAYMDNYGLLAPEVSGLCTLIGAILLLLALWIQFGKKKGGTGTGPRL